MQQGRGRRGHKHTHKQIFTQILQHNARKCKIQLLIAICNMFYFYKERKKNSINIITQRQREQQRQHGEPTASAAASAAAAHTSFHSFRTSAASCLSLCVRVCVLPLSTFCFCFWIQIDFFHSFPLALSLFCQHFKCTFHITNAGAQAFQLLATRL